MNIAGLRSIGLAILFVLLAGASCNRPKRASSESSAAPTPQGIRGSITAHAPDVFYDPPSDVSQQPGALLRSEPMKDVILPAGMRGWRILYATTVDDNTPATAVATVVAATAPAANIKNILAMNVDVDKRFGPYLALSYSRFYPDITFEQAVRPEALDAARQIVNLCDFVPPEDQERIEALAATFDGPALAMNSNKPLQARLEQNTADGSIQAPVVIAQGLSDIVVPASATDVYVEERCSAGQRLEYWTFAGRDHITIVQPGTPLEELLITWTTARFANEPPASGCVHKSF